MIAIWLSGLLRRRRARLAGASVGIAIAVALLASLGSFLAHSKATMTKRAVQGVAVDWQVQVQPGADPVAVTRLVAATSGVLAAQPVGFGQTSGLTATAGGSTQSTGPGVVVGIPSRYRATFPQVIRSLAGTPDGALVFQQTASNLHTAPGDTVMIGRAGLAPVRVVVAGVVDLPQVDSLFQKVGAPVGAQRTAPPDNVVLLPSSQWHQIFDPLGKARPDLVATQVHALRDHRLPADPAQAYTAVTAAAHNLEAKSAGTAVVGDNVGAALDAARGDAAYAQVLFLFLGLPGAILAGLLTATIASAGATRRQVEQALLRARGASARQLLRLAAAEAAVIGGAGAVLGLGTAAVVGRAAFGTARFGTTSATAAGWAAIAAGIGLAIAGAAVLVPARRDLRERTVNAGRETVGAQHYPWWARVGLDVGLLVIAYLVFHATSRNGYQLVLAPEGVPTISVSYWALAGPALLWIGAGLLAWRLADLLLGRGRPVLRRVLRPLTGTLAGPVAGGMSRQRRPLARAIVLLALALSFAASTATFNATYHQQAAADAQLSNGADVTVTVAAGSTVHPAAAGQLAGVNGVRAVEPLQHRFAYIGTDLQDLYGVRPDHIRDATALQDAYFTGGSAAALMHTLATQPSSILVSAETVKDYQLRPGDLVKLRLIDSRTRQPRLVEFHYVGVVTEFPTAPKDSFFVANASYVAQQTGTDAVGAFLVDTGGKHTTSVVHRIQSLLGPAATVTDIATVRKNVGSSLTSVDLGGLTRVELTFALLLAAAAGGLVLALGLTERRRSFAIATALGAKARHLRAMIVSEAAVLAVFGLTAGSVIGWLLSHMLVKVLTGVFDPPPSVIAVPWAYLSSVAGIAIAAFGLASIAAVRAARRPAVSVLRDL
ncbi:MAG: ABC transporter permease [Pseudonocardiales bacterium]|nr:MAG: ABC transporter permease [Pseudonocardiales bacterium]